MKSERHSRGRKPDSPAPASSRTGSMGSPSVDVEALREILDLLEGTDVKRLYWAKGEERLCIRREPALSSTGGGGGRRAEPLPAEPAPARAEASVAAVAAKTEKPGAVVTSPFVGTFYRAPAPDQPSFVEVGAIVKKGQVLCIVEAMKLMNEIEAEVTGRVAEALAENGQAVEFGQPLFRIEPV